MLAVVKKPHIEIRARHIPAPLLRAIRELYKPENVIVEDDELINPAEIPELIEARRNTSPGEAIYLNRDMRGWSQVELAKKLGVAVTVVSNMENNRRAVSRKMAKKLGEAFGCVPASFFEFK